MSDVDAIVEALRRMSATPLPLGEYDDVPTLAHALTDYMAALECWRAVRRAVEDGDWDEEQRLAIVALDATDRARAHLPALREALGLEETA